MRLWTILPVVGLILGVGAAPASAAGGAPTGLTTAGRPCAAEAPGPYLSPERLNAAQAVVLQGDYAGGDEGAELVADFQVWDVTTPDEPQQWRTDLGPQNDEVYIQLEDSSRQLDGVTYAWRVRVLDGDEASPWSGTCFYTVDRTAGDAPGVRSEQYPAGGWDEAGGGVDVPGRFVLTATADDTVSYSYRFYSAESGGPDDYSSVNGKNATVDWTPTSAGYHSLSVYAVDRAGNMSAPHHYEFQVRENRPSVFSAAYPDGAANLDYNVGVPGEFEFTATLAGTESFAWRIDGNGPSGSAPADENGKATVLITPTRAGSQTLHVRSVTADGVEHPARAYRFLVDNAPRVTGDLNRAVYLGSSLKFHLEPRMPGVEAYLYWTQSGSGEQSDRKETLPTRADGTADLTWTATNDNADTIGLYLQSRSSGGALSEPRRLPVSVFDASPSVSREGGEVLGSPATFTAVTEMENVTEYEAVFNNDPATRRVLEPAADGSVTFRFTTTKREHNQVTVVARNAAGVRTGEGSASWYVTDSPLVTSTDFPSSGGRIGPGTFAFTARQAGVTKYEWSFGGVDFETIDADEDGGATLHWTAPDAGFYALQVRSLTASNVRSVEAFYLFTVEPDPLTVTSVAPASVAGGGVRTITISGSGLTQEDEITVTPAAGPALTATVRSVSADRRTTTAEVDLTSTAGGSASVSVRPNAWSDAVTLADAFTITTQPTLRSTAPPVVTGAVTVGSTVRASAGRWTPAATAHTYQWAADGTAVTGATAATYRIPPALLGKRLTVTVTATRAGHTSATASSARTTAVAKGIAPRATTPPRISGTPRVGQTVQAETGTWSPTADSYRYEWRLAGTRLNTTTKTLTLTPAMQNKPLTVTVIARKAAHHDGRATSPPLTVRPS